MRRPRPLILLIIAEVVGCILLAALALAVVFSPAPSIPLVTLAPTLTPPLALDAAPTATSIQIVAAAPATSPSTIETATPILLPTLALSTAEGATPVPADTQTQTPTVLASDTPGVLPPTVPSQTPLPPSATAAATAGAPRPDTPTSTRTPAPTTTSTQTPTPTQTLTPTPTPTLTPPPPPAYISGITSNAREIFVRGQSLGNRAHAFALVGDSNTDNPAFFAPFDAGNYTLGAYAYLQATINYFSGSFARDSVAAVGGFNTAKVLDPDYNDPARCQPDESPLECEYRLQSPSVVLILLGTGDQHTWEAFEYNYRVIVESTIAHGIIPVLITKADDLESTENTAPPGYINSIIVQLSGEYGVPLLDLRQAIEPLPNRGLLPDGFHYNSPGDGQFANFTDGYLDYGFNVRNLTGLQVLDALRRQVMYDTP